MVAIENVIEAVSVTEASNFEAELDAMRACATAIEPLTEDAKLRTLTWLMERYGRDMLSEMRSSSAVGQPAGSLGVGPRITTAQAEVTPKRFVQEKLPQTDVERIAVLAYYLASNRGVQHFKTSDLTALNTEAAQRRFSNAADAASNAMKSSGFLADAGKGMRQLTVKGEEAVEALPDREALMAVIDKYSDSRRRRPAKGARSTTEE